MYWRRSYVIHVGQAGRPGIDGIRAGIVVRGYRRHRSFDGVGATGGQHVQPNYGSFLGIISGQRLATARRFFLCYNRALNGEVANGP